MDPRDASSANHVRVLLVDQDAEFVAAARSAFAAAGYAAVDALREDDALLRIFRGEEYDAIVYDIAGRPEDAISFRLRIAAMSPSLAARIVFLSAEEIPLSLASARIAKPIGAEALVSWLTEFVSLRTVRPAAFSR